MKKMIILLVIFLTPAVTGIVLAGGNSLNQAKADTYFDIATGHKYIKNTDNTYSEYSKRGKLLRSDVPNTLPLRVSGKYIHEVTPNHYLVYEKQSYNDLAQKILPGTSLHPDGWQCKKLMSQVQEEQVEAYEPAD